MEAWIIEGRRSQAHLRWTWNGNGFELLAPIAPNKNWMVILQKSKCDDFGNKPPIPQVCCWGDNLHKNKTYPTFWDGQKCLLTN
jgi:hypothetical protein